MQRVFDLDLDIAMKLSMSRIPYEGARAVCQAPPLLITAPDPPNLPRLLLPTFLDNLQKVISEIFLVKINTLAMHYGLRVVIEGI